jgi:hypothetical protein
MQLPKVVTPRLVLAVAALASCRTGLLEGEPPPDAAADLTIAPDFATPVSDLAGPPSHHALLCDGIDDEVAIDVAGLLDHVQAFTVELWLRADGKGPIGTTLSGQRPLSSLPRQLGQDPVYLDLSDFNGQRLLTAVFMDACGGTEVMAGGLGVTLDAPNAWHHFAAQYELASDGSYLYQSFIDGVPWALQIEEPGVAYCFAPQKIVLCHGKVESKPEAAPFLGAIDDLRLSSAARYEGPFVPAPPVADAATVALLRFESLPLVDESGHGLAVTVAGDPQLTGADHP